MSSPTRQFELTEEERQFVLRCMETESRNEPLFPHEHMRLIRFVDMGLVEIDGFKYCWPETAKDNWRRAHKGAAL